MDFKNVVQASAEVVSIVRLKRGDVYKRVIPATDYTAAKMQLGVVTSVMNNGSEAAVASLEYAADYTAGVVATQFVFTQSDAPAIFPATPEEVREHVAEMRQAIDRKVRVADDELEKVRGLAERTREVLDGMIELSAPEVGHTIVAGEVEA